MKRMRKVVITILLFSISFNFLVENGANAAKKVKLNKTKISLKVGRTYQLKLKNTKKKVKWSSKDKMTATVSKKGKVKGISAGKTKIIAKIGKKKYACSVVVKDETKNDSQTQSNPVPTKVPTPTTPRGAASGSNVGIDTSTGLYMTGDKVTYLVVGKTLKYYAWHLPSGAVTSRKISWTSSNSDVASVKDGLVTAVSPGAAVIKASDGKYEETRMVLVKPAVQSISWESATKTLYKGKSCELKFSVLPEDAEARDLVFSSSNDKVVTVSSTLTVGQVRIEAKSLGTAVITVSDADKKVSASCEITVVSPVTISVPELPQTITQYQADGTRKSVLDITDISYEVEETYLEDVYGVTIRIKGKKTYDVKGDSYSRAGQIGWKLYKDAELVQDSGTWFTVALSNGEMFSEEKYINRLPAGNYELRLFNID